MKNRTLPAPNSDFYELAQTLSADELALVKQVRAFMESKVAPVINKYWVDDAFLFELLPEFKKLNIGDPRSIVARNPDFVHADIACPTVERGHHPS